MTRLFSTALATLAVATIVGCSAPAAGPALDLALTHSSEAHRYVVTLEPPDKPIAIGRFETWRVHLTTPDGASVHHARLIVDGGMPQHGHGLPSQPRVTQELADGAYVIEGMKFSMSGWWAIRLAIDADAGPDQVAFNVVVDPQGPAK